MENPCLTFLTPSILAGDRSLVDVVAHEISHSWTGNLVACASWEHFWLNEGFTMYLERKILSKLYGESYRQFDSLIGLADLRESIALFGKFSPATALSPCLKTTHPDDVFSSVPYEKGYTLLYVLEQFVGGPSKFDPFFRAYIDHFSWMAIDSNQFVQFTKDFFDPQNDQLKSFPWDTWIKGTGMPVVIPQYSQQLVEPCHHLALLTKKLDEKLSSEVDGKPPIIHPNYLDESAMQSTAKIEPNSEKSTNSLELEHPPCEFGLVDITEMKELLYSKYRELSPPQKVMYLDILLVQVGDGSLVDPLRIGHLLSDIFSQEMMSVDNVEILLKWHLLNIRTGNVHAFKAASIFATKHGRMKYCRPILRELYASGAKELACQTFNSNREFYHPIAAQMICKDLHLSY